MTRRIIFISLFLCFGFSAAQADEETQESQTSFLEQVQIQKPEVIEEKLQEKHENFLENLRNLYEKFQLERER